MYLNTLSESTQQTLGINEIFLFFTYVIVDFLTFVEVALAPWQTNCICASYVSQKPHSSFLLLLPAIFTLNNEEKMYSGNSFKFFVSLKIYLY
jgi:hypothetical protein